MGGDFKTRPAVIVDSVVNWVGISCRRRYSGYVTPQPAPHASKPLSTSQCQ